MHYPSASSLSTSMCILYSKLYHTQSFGTTNHVESQIHSILYKESTPLQMNAALGKYHSTS